MPIRLVPNARRVFRHSWTSHILIIGGLLSAAEAALPYLSGSDLISPTIFPFVAFGVVFAAFVARYVLQETLHNGDD
ncbi:conserved hypothetical protein [uncultured Pleomorphomonas sp.]|uniref:Uncharacterized protein n=1 Tax=uncultured Pleomorphomonas sp. TaxID=442121 RepID=A0A212L1N0_9HYPH|nr:hypothetical protein [uncultured Pleomorphomonas sp.]SCM71474.1 conserved hypothetical protein [uncultured Pleomorphomonas sp.]